MNTFEPVEHIHTLLQVQHPHQAGQHHKDGCLSGTEAVNDQGGLVIVGEPGDTVHQVNTVRHGDTQVRPVGAEYHLDHMDLVSHLQLETH